MNIVQVVRHGWLAPFKSHYYFDMEFCDETLDHYIAFPPFSREEIPVMHLLARSLPIIIDIAGGLKFIHGHNQVHRDLKPKNGSVISLRHSLISSLIFTENWMLEDRRLRHLF